MRRAMIATALLALLTSGALAGPKEDALAAYDKFFTSFTTGNQNQLAALFAPDALFYGTASPEVVVTPEGVLAYFTNASVVNVESPKRVSPLFYQTTTGKRGT